MISGFINIDKPAGITSHDVIFRLRRSIKIKRMGHTGTLDPDATGVLPVAIGPTCRLIDYLAKDKVYFAEIMLGVRTNTDDLSGRVLESKEIDISIDRFKIEKILQNFVGTIQQTPPFFSAVHHNGQRLHHVARLAKHSSANTSEIANVLSCVQERHVQVEKIEIVSVELPVISLRINCSAGTYIRSLARDLGELLGCGACLKFLRREKSGLFELSQSTELDTALSLIEQGKLSQLIIPPQNVLNFKIIRLNSEATALILNGRYLDLKILADHKNLPGDSPNLDPEIATLNENEKVILLSQQDDQLIALGRIAEQQFIKPEVVLLGPLAAIKV